MIIVLWLCRLQHMQLIVKMACDHPYDTWWPCVHHEFTNFTHDYSVVLFAYTWNTWIHMEYIHLGVYKLSYSQITSAFSSAVSCTFSKATWPDQNSTCLPRQSTKPLEKIFWTNVSLVKQLSNADLHQSIRIPTGLLWPRTTHGSILRSVYFNL